MAPFNSLGGSPDFLTVHQDEVPDDEADEDEAPDEDGPMDDDNEARGCFGTSIFLEVGYNPPKTNKEPQNGALKKMCFLFKMVIFRFQMFIFQGVH